MMSSCCGSCSCGGKDKDKEVTQDQAESSVVKDQKDNKPGK